MQVLLPQSVMLGSEAMNIQNSMIGGSENPNDIYSI